MKIRESAIFEIKWDAVSGMIMKSASKITR